MKRLYKSRTNKQIDGICGGIAEYFNVDPTLVRVICVIFACCGGAGILAYLICAFIIPEKPDNSVVDVE